MGKPDYYSQFRENSRMVFGQDSPINCSETFIAHIKKIVWETSEYIQKIK